MTMRAHLLERIRPMVDQLALDLVALVDEHIESRLAKMTQAFDVALSAAASELQDVGDAEPEQNGRKPLRLKAKPEALAAAKERKASPQIPPRVVPPSQGKSCSKCGQVGANSRGCGTTHNVNGGSAPPSSSRIGGVARAILERTKRARPEVDEDDEEETAEA